MRHFIFRNLEAETKDLIVKQMRTFELDTGELLYTQGNPGTHFFVVGAGFLDI
jgi:CRP-like cAMP-binding protein